MESHLPDHPLSAAGGEGPGERARREARVGLYVHVPFCATRCSYCDFSSGAPGRDAHERYLEALEREIGLRAPQAAGLKFSSVFFGGGTPSLLAARSFRRVARALRAGFDIAPDAEITLEANPESVRDALLEAWAEGGVNRLSMGAQSFVPRELETLGRIHPAERPREAFERARACGFRRLSLDLMFGFPGHTPEGWARSLEEALALAPEHLSAYCFIPEPGTPLGNAVLRGEARLPSGDAQAEGYGVLGRTLESAGYACYETSNFCRPDAEARHNLVYWLRRPYLALGPSAHGLIGGVRYGNHYALDRWASCLEAGVLPEVEREPETDEQVAREIMMLGLRLAGGIDARDHDGRVWRAVVRRYAAVWALAIREGRLEATPHGVRVPRRFRFVADDAIAWVEAHCEPALAMGVRGAPDRSEPALAG